MPERTRLPLSAVNSQNTIDEETVLFKNTVQFTHIAADVVNDTVEREIQHAEATGSHDSRAARSFKEEVAEMVKEHHHELAWHRAQLKHLKREKVEMDKKNKNLEECIQVCEEDIEAGEQVYAQVAAERDHYRQIYHSQTMHGDPKESLKAWDAQLREKKAKRNQNRDELQCIYNERDEQENILRQTEEDLANVMERLRYLRHHQDKALDDVPELPPSPEKDPETGEYDMNTVKRFRDGMLKMFCDYPEALILLKHRYFGDAIDITQDEVKVIAELPPDQRREEIISLIELSERAGQDMIKYHESKKDAEKMAILAERWRTWCERTVQYDSESRLKVRFSLRLTDRLSFVIRAFKEWQLLTAKARYDRRCRGEFGGSVSSALPQVSQPGGPSRHLSPATQAPLVPPTTSRARGLPSCPDLAPHRRISRPIASPPNSNITELPRNPSYSANTENTRVVRRLSTSQPRVAGGPLMSTNSVPQLTRPPQHVLITPAGAAPFPQGRSAQGSPLFQPHSAPQRLAPVTITPPAVVMAGHNSRGYTPYMPPPGVPAVQSVPAHAPRPPMMTPMMTTPGGPMLPRPPAPPSWSPHPALFRRN